MGAGFADAKVAAAADRLTHARPSSRCAESGLNAAEQRFAADLALIVKLLQGAFDRQRRLFGIAGARQRRSAAVEHAGRDPRRGADADRGEPQDPDEDGRAVEASLDELVNKIEKLRSNLAEANDKAMRDSLTGLGNRRFFDEELELVVEGRCGVCVC